MTADHLYWQSRLPDNIFLAGPMASGKDHLAALLIERAGFTKIAFADALKEEVAAANGISVEELTVRKAEFRRQLQDVGVGRREADPYHWICEWSRRRLVVSGPVVCTDCRFPNEAEYGLQIGALLIRLSVPDEVREQRLRARDGAFDPATLSHISEQYIKSMPVHAEISGEMAADLYLPLLAEIYAFQQGLVAEEV